jgi:hypothetical protein
MADPPNPVQSPGSEPPAPSSAIDEIVAAELLAADDQLGPSLARVHLRRAWEELHAQATTEEDLLSWSGTVSQTRVDADAREAFERVRRWALGESVAPSPGADDVFGQTAVLRELATDGRQPRRTFAVIGAALFVVIGLAMVLSAVVSLVRGPTGPWRGEWYDNQDYEGDPVIQNARKIEFNWGRSSPGVRGIGRDRWSVIWRTCMELEEDTEIRFRIASDDGSRLYVDGDLVVDNWGAHAVRTRTGKIALEAGVHYLRLDYFEASATAEVTLHAAFGDETEYSTIPVSMLSPPGEGEDPC